MENKGKEQPSKGSALGCRFQAGLAALWLKKAKECSEARGPSRLAVLLRDSGGSDGRGRCGSHGDWNIPEVHVAASSRQGPSVHSGRAACRRREVQNSHGENGADGRASPL